MKISEVTKRNVFDELQLKKISWYGRLDEVSFLSRIFNLDGLASKDARFDNMRGDIWQHRENNDDWDDWWVIDDDRLDLMKNDDNFLQFLCQIVHPIVRRDRVEVDQLLNIINSHLAPDGWKLVEKSRISGQPVFAPVQYKADIDFRNEREVSQKFSGDQLIKCKEKIEKGDYYGAITNARSFIEAVIADIYKRITGEEINIIGGLPDKYRQIKNLLKFAPEQQANKELKSLCGGMTATMHALDQISNEMGERHVPASKPEEYHARFYVGACQIIADFLYDRLAHIYQNKENLFTGIISALEEGNKRSLSRDELIVDTAIQNILEKCDSYAIALLKNKFISDYAINYFRDNDIFFAAMRIFFDNLDKSDLNNIFEKCKDNNQALPPYGGLVKFLLEVSEKKQDLLTSEINKFFSKYNKKAKGVDIKDIPL